MAPSDHATPVTGEARYARLASAFGETVAGVPPDAWDARTPCTDWTVRDLVAHVTANTGVFLQLVGEEPPELPAAQQDLAAAWHASDRAMRAALANPAIATREFDGYFGPTTFGGAVDGFVAFDLIVHRWDLAVATGQDPSIGSDDLLRLAAAAQEFGPALRRPGVCGTALDPPPDADEQTRVLAFLGRAV